MRRQNHIVECQQFVVTAARCLILRVEREAAEAIFPQRFYQRHGYAQVGALPSLVVDGIDELIYWKRLRS